MNLGEFPAVPKPIHAISNELPESSSPVILRDDPTFTIEEVMPAYHLQWMMGSSVRQYATGVSADGDRFKLYYTDHRGISMSYAFSLLQHPELLVLVVAAISTAHPCRLGFCPFLDAAVTSNWSSLDGFSMTFPEAIDEDDTIEYNWRLQIDKAKRSIFNTWEVVGRGTNVVPVRILSEKGSVENSNSAFVVKFAFPEDARRAEDDEIRRIQRCLRESDPRATRHVVRLVASFTATTTQIGLPAEFLGYFSGDPTRSLRVILMEAYLPISDLHDNTPEFKKVMVDVVKGMLNDHSDVVFSLTTYFDQHTTLSTCTPKSSTAISAITT